MVLSLLGLGHTAAKAAKLLLNLDLGLEGDLPAFSAATPITGSRIHDAAPRGPYKDGLSSEQSAGHPQRVTADGTLDDWWLQPFQGDCDVGRLSPQRAARDRQAFHRTSQATAGSKYILTGWAGAETDYAGLTRLTASPSPCSNWNSSMLPTL